MHYRNVIHTSELNAEPFSAVRPFANGLLSELRMVLEHHNVFLLMHEWTLWHGFPQSADIIGVESRCWYPNYDIGKCCPLLVLIPLWCYNVLPPIGRDQSHASEVLRSSGLA